mmetsp:Transcript_78282/g.210648  ORF Transcript_78282/g.210648 Transcript_78282/m.210648 type:complete len:105 (+) Transcript_78282:447-761(+)|eukprot:CAMPEP_0113672344 /NCGR_PEP_ID=MMETSP0038_2-20120614/6211_1 /TAXON_ID=2898 /ORGANISM="Cryptomonas paramecium" /LENGTH=104 /DNA_ID=CAMNT_0000588603 /DNA_START=178 /DNA_END=492 /DNA_ORIENTATION=+ /assembly_acc=CAM_ASM_000170
MTFEELTIVEMAADDNVSMSPFDHDKSLSKKSQSFMKKCTVVIEQATDRSANQTTVNRRRGSVTEAPVSPAANSFSLSRVPSSQDRALYNFSMGRITDMESRLS